MEGQSKSSQPPSTADHTIIIDPPHSKHPTSEEEAACTSRPDQPPNAVSDNPMQGQTLGHSSSGRRNVGPSKTGLKGAISSKLLGEDVPPEKLCLGSSFPAVLKLSPKSEAQSLAEIRELLDRPPSSASASTPYQGGRNDRVSIFGPRAPMARSNKLAQNKDRIQKLWGDSTVENSETNVQAVKTGSRPGPVNARHSGQEDERGRDIESILVDKNTEVAQLPAIAGEDFHGGKHAALDGSTPSPDFVICKDKKPIPLTKPGGDPSASLSASRLDVSTTSSQPFVERSNSGVDSAQANAEQSRVQATQSSTTAVNTRQSDQKYGHRRGQRSSLSGAAIPFYSPGSFTLSSAATSTQKSALPAALDNPRVPPPIRVRLPPGPSTAEGHKTPRVPGVQNTFPLQMQSAHVMSYAQASAYPPTHTHAGGPAANHTQQPSQTHDFPQARAQTQLQSRRPPHNQPQQPQQRLLPGFRTLPQPQFQPVIRAAAVAPSPPNHGRFSRPEQHVRHIIGFSTDPPSPSTATTGHGRFSRPEQDVPHIIGFSTDPPSSSLTPATTTTTQSPAAHPNTTSAPPPYPPYPQALDPTVAHSGPHFPLPPRPLISAARGTGSGSRRGGRRRARGRGSGRESGTGRGRGNTPPSTRQ